MSQKSKKKPGPKFVNPTVKERVLADVAKLRGFRYNQYEIAEKLGVSQPMVSNYEKELRKRYASVQFEETSALIAEKVAQYDEVIRQAAQAFVESKTVKTETDEEGNETVTVSPGEAVFLAKVMDALKAQRELLGLDAPTKVDARSVNLNFSAGNEPVVGFDALSEPEPVEAEIERVKSLPAHVNGKAK